MNYHKFIRTLLYCSLAFFTNCARAPTESSVSIETLPPDGQPTEIIPPTTWEEEHSLPNRWDGGLFSETPCQAPCFASIVPGTTTETEVMNIIEDDAYFQNCQLEDIPNRGRSVSCKGLIINIDKTDSTVDALGFKTLQQFSIEDVMSKYGEPTMTWVIPMGIPEAPEISMVVAWEEEKISINLEDQEGVAYQLVPSTAVTNIVYYSETGNDSTIFSQPWHGHGEYVVDDD